MCGIAGLIDFEGRDVGLDELRAMTDRMVYRGPDDEGFFHEGNVGVGMRRLSIIDLDGGRQPIRNEDGSLVLVLNGEIYNFIELRERLRRRGHVFATGSDIEVVLHLYEEMGTAALAELNGMFALALWDRRRRALWIARDRLGIKPLYFRHSGPRLVFASDLNALRGLGELQVNREALLQYLALAYVPAPGTIYNGVQKLPPAHFLWIQDGKVEQRCYWQVRDIGTWRGSEDDAVEELRHLLADSVGLQLRSDVPLGIFLSGGLDSSTIVALAAKQQPKESLETLTIEFAGKGAADARFARMVAARHGVRHHEVEIGSAQAARSLDELLRHLDEPIADSAIIPSFLLSQIARDTGLKVLLTGAGGDEIFGGYSRYWPARRGSPTWIADTFPGPMRQAIAKLYSIWRPDRAARMADPVLAMAVGISGVNLHAIGHLLREPAFHQTVLGTIQSEFSGMLLAERRYGRAYGRMSIDLQKYLVEDVLSVNDKTTMAASVEGRVPLLDHRLVEFAFALPPTMNLAGRSPKGLLRRVMSAELPSDLLHRTKEGFNGPIHLWLEEADRLDVASELLDSPTPLIQEIVCPKALRALLNDPGRRRTAASTLFSLFLFNRWYRVQHE